MKTRTRQAGQDKNKLGSAGQAEYDRQKQAGRTGHPERDRKEEWKIRMDRQNRIGRHDRHNWTGISGQANRNEAT